MLKPWTERKERDRFNAVLEQVCFAEELGFSSVWFMQHHFAPEWSHSSAPDLVMAALTQRTARIRLGIAVILTPVHHPLNVAARMATLDILSHGRLDVGIGRSGHPYQLSPFGVRMEDTRGMWEETLRILPQAWAEGEFSFDGRYLRLPPREVAPKPIRKPHPPL